MFKKRISVFKRRLTTVGDAEPLNKLSLAVIILLDIFILSVIFGGLDEHTKELTQPYEYMPPEARQIFINQSWSPSTRIDRLQTLVLTDRKHYSYRHESIFDPSKLKQMHPLCRNFYEKTKKLTQDADLQQLFIDREQKTAEQRKLIAAQNRAKKAYDTQLLETIADPQRDTRTRSIAERSKNLTAQIESLTFEIAAIDRQINAHPGVQEIWRIVSPQNQNRQQIIDDFRRFERWYKFRELGWQLLFLLPIFGIFYLWGVRSIKNENRVQALISGHMLVVSAIPILFKVIEVVIDLIPEQFFKNLFKVLKSLHLIAIWHYLVIFAGIGIALLLVFLIQKKVFNREKMMQKRLAKGACIHCSKKLPYGASSCPFCGKQQLKTCPKCEQQTPAGGAFCIHCGTGLN